MKNELPASAGASLVVTVCCLMAGLWPLAILGFFLTYWLEQLDAPKPNSKPKPRNEVLESLGIRDDD